VNVWTSATLEQRVPSYSSVRRRLNTSDELRDAGKTTWRHVINYAHIPLHPSSRRLSRQGLRRGRRCRKMPERFIGNLFPTRVKNTSL